MFKKIVISIFLLFCVSLLLFFAVKFLIPKKEIIFDQTNKTFVVKGDVKVKKNKEGAAWQAMDASTVLEKGDIVETSPDSSVDIIIGKNVDKSVKVEEKSQVEFQQINPAYLNCSKGKVMVALKKLEDKSSFTVKTPTAICGARGTAWLVDTTGPQTKICVFESKVYLQEIDEQGKARLKQYTAVEGTQRTLSKDKPISEVQAIGEKDWDSWKYWSKSIDFLRDGKILVNDFNKKENFNNLSGSFGSWVVFYSDTNQHCRDTFSSLEKLGDSGYCLKLDYDVDSPFSAYNGFFTKLMGIDLTGYKNLIFYIKGDKQKGFTTRVNVELKNQREIGKIEVKGITDEWQKIVLPIEKFVGIKSLVDMKELVIVFSDLTATKKEGVIYIDDIYFTKSEE